VCKHSHRHFGNGIAPVTRSGGTHGIDLDIIDHARREAGEGSSSAGGHLALFLLAGLLATSVTAQTNIYLFSGSKTNITLNPGTYIITAYGAPGGGFLGNGGGLGAEMSGEFNFSTSTNLTLLVGGAGGFTSTSFSMVASRPT
jgi:hypothetical protein